MDDLENLQQLEKQQVQIHEEVHEEILETAKVENAMKPLEKWDSQGELLEQEKQSFLESRLERVRHQNEEVMRAALQREEEMRAGQKKTKGTARRAAKLQAPPTQAEEGQKEKRQRLKKRKEAAKKSPVGDEYTYDMITSLKAAQLGKDNVLNTPGVVEKAQEKKIDIRMLRVFINGYQGKNGVPADAKQEKLLNQDGNLLNSYFSANKQMREPFLNGVVNELLTVELKPDMFTAPYLAKHASEMKSTFDKMVYFDNLKQENPEYFKNIPQSYKEALDRRRELWNAFGGALTSCFGKYGVNMNMAEYYGMEDQPAIESGEMMSDVMLETFRQKLTEETQATDAMLNEKIEKAVQAARIEKDQQDAMRDSSYKDPAKAMKEGVFVDSYTNSAKDMNKDLEDFKDITFTSHVTQNQYADVANMRKLIEDNPQRYQDNKELVDRVYQEFYRLLDVNGGVSSELKVRQQATDIIAPNYLQRTVFDVMAGKRLLKIQEKLQDTQSALLARTGAVEDYLRHLLKGSELGALGQKIKDEFNGGQNNPE